MAETRLKEESLETKLENELVPTVNLTEPEPESEVAKWAEKNINESPNDKLALIEELRDMIFERGECEPHRTDDAFLLRFLRARHFIVRMAHRLIVNYYTYRETYPNLFFDIDFEKLVQIGESEIFSVPPYFDHMGRRILYLRIENWNPNQFSIDDLLQAVIFLIQAAILEPKHQIMGGICVLDVGNISTGQAWYMSPSVIKHIIAIAYKSLPHRIEALHIINVSKVFDYAFSMMKPFLSDVMKKRVFIHQDLEGLHEHVSPKYLPKRFGGIHKDYLYNDWLNILHENENLVEELESYGYQGGKEFLKSLKKSSEDENVV
ncbi:unnamed protein product [Ceutorhynchus assimilis]|uniref:CRAL-TRIO domain-containing protein n=1 Tax=Ceutorhynchus assimilis TaxID=467358 RepID=A0A9N9MUZ2_9CUCU|nr:unnamed protein product [Ceutorhynchus assimilis]